MVNCALGKAILATFSDEALRELAERHGMQRYTSHSLRSAEALLQDIRAARRRGFAMDDGEFVANVRCVAVPVFDPLGEAIASLSISALAGRVNEARFQELGQIALRAGSQLTEVLGGSVPHPLNPDAS